MSDTVPSDGLWQDALVEAWSEGRTAPASIRHLLRIQGLPDAPPADPYRRARLLALLTDLTIDEIVAACPGADPFKVEAMVEAIPPTAYDIIDAHRKGFTPLEMEQHLGITRTLAY